MGSMPQLRRSQSKSLGFAVGADSIFGSDPKILEWSSVEGDPGGYFSRRRGSVLLGRLGKPLSLRTVPPPTDTHLSLTEACSGRWVPTAPMGWPLESGVGGLRMGGPSSRHQSCPALLQLMELALAVVWGPSSVHVHAHVHFIYNFFSNYFKYKDVFFCDLMHQQIGSNLESIPAI